MNSSFENNKNKKLKKSTYRDEGMSDKLFSNTFPDTFHNSTAVSQTNNYDSLEDFDNLEKDVDETDPFSDFD